MPFYVSFRAMLRCLCLVTSMKLLQRLLGISPVLSYSCWLGDCFYLSCLASISLPKKKNEKKESSVIFYTSSCCKSGCESTLRSTGKTVCGEHWELTPHMCSESFMASLHWFSIHCAKWIVVLKMHLFFEGRKKTIQTEL